MNRYQVGLLAAVVLIVAAAIFAASQPSADTSAGRPANAGVTNTDLVPVSQRPAAPPFTGLAGWLNSPPLTVAGLRGQVVLIDFWTYSCVNCIRTLPHLQGLQARYGGKGLTIVGMHSPEFDFEKSQPNVSAAVKRLNVTWPVALDSKMATWNAFSNQYWPAEYLIDQSGRVAYLHDGEGDYNVTESAIAALLGTGGPSPTPAPPTPDVSSQTPEVYAGSARGQQLGDGEGYASAGQPTNYPGSRTPSDTDRIVVGGTWADHGQYLVSTAPGHVLLNFSARDLYLVAGPDSSSPVHVTVSVDGGAVAAAQLGPDLTASGLDVAGQELFHLLTGEGGNRHVIDLAVPGGFRLYTFTFG